jgi:hypothetical protein
VRYAITTAAATAPVFGSTDTFNFISGSTWLYIEVTAQNSTVTYYCFEVTTLDGTATVSAISFDGTVLTSLPTSDTAWNSAAAPWYTLTSASQLSSLTVAATPTVTGATVNYGKTTTANGEVTWSTSGTITGLASGDYIGIRVVAANGTTTQYYKIRVSYGSSDATLTSITVGNVSATLGTPGNFTGTFGGFTGTVGTVTLTSAQAGDGTSVVVMATPAAGAIVRYDWGGNAFGSNIASGAWKETGDGLFAGGSLFSGFVTVVPGVNNALVFVEVTSENRMTVNVYAVSCRVSN